MPCHYSSSWHWQVPSTSEATGGAELHSVPFLAMTLLKPSDGFPLLQDWLTIATDIFHQGFEGWRECVEVRCLNGSSLGKPLQYACLTPTKGITRSSIIMFGILFTFYNFKDKMTDEEVNDFSRPAEQFSVRP